MDAKKLCRRIAHLQSDASQERYKRVKLFGGKVDLADHYGRQLEGIEENLRLERTGVASTGDVRIFSFQYVCMFNFQYLCFDLHIFRCKCKIYVFILKLCRFTVKYFGI